ncbi:hypothetical protein EUGRSUZ_E04279 [Eucalyptus grandis]|uniref:Uncharacterized protein n=2 Tax=Eucalyptus grandis TaxID=71139 RepID=A0ACC3L1B3_EUCGR|nr:hypothetical protein EUGRSUZ_E04279 [Eucalyptus grandis]
MKKKALWALVVIWGITCGSRGCWEQERVALLALNATFDLIYRVDTGGSYFNCCSWEGVECNPTTGRVTHLMLFSSRYYLSGFKTWYLNASLLLPFEELKSLDLFNNHLTGWIAPEEPNLLSSRLSKLEELDLNGNSLDNSILSILATIPSLRCLSLRNSNLSGTLHVNGDLSNLKELDISIKNLSHLENLYLDYVHLKHVGTVVQALGALSSLRILSLQHNTIEGTITTQGLCNLVKLEELDLSFNGITGRLPTCWRNMSSIRILNLEDNEFTDSVVSSPLTSLTSLEFLSILGSHFDIPSSLGPLTNHSRLKLTTEFWANVPNLSYLNLSANILEGTIPSELGSVKSLDILDLSSNNFSGGLPIQLLDGKLNVLSVAYNNLQGEIVLSNHTMNPGLSRLRLEHNLFNGSLSFLSSIVNLRELDVSNNIFTGKLPRLIANMSSLVALDLSKNQLDGLIPQELWNFGELEYLDLSNNNLSGSLPLFFISEWVRHIHLSRNKLNGTLVHALSNGLRLVTLDLSENEFSGSIPYWLGSLSQLKILLLKGNSFYGTFPEQLCRLKSLKVEEKFQAPHTVGFTTKGRFDSYKGYTLLKMVGLDFSCNQFSGEIPSEIAISQEMLVLNLSHNKLIGRIPMSLSSLTKIESIDLSYNNLIGSIPEELTQLNSLEVFNVSYNNLSGAIPNKYQFGAFDESSYYGNHLLCGLPLSKKCSTTINDNCSTTKSRLSTKEDGFIDEETFYISFGVSYTMVGLVIPIVLFINPQWRHGWFHYVELVINTCQSLFITCYYFVQDGFRKFVSSYLHN